MNETSYPDKIKTPIDALPPVPGIQDHGMVLVHEMGGKPRNYLHEVSIEDSDAQGKRTLQSFGYCEHRGWRRGGVQYWVYSKAYTLSVARW